MDNLTVVVPYWNGLKHVNNLLADLPDGLPVVIVDDHSDQPLRQQDVIRPDARIIRPPEKGHFSGAVNAGLAACKTDVLILNQDARLNGAAWLDMLAEKRGRYAAIGHGVMDHPAWPAGYIQGTFMFIRRDAWRKVGGFNVTDYPLWGATCEWQLRAARAGFEVLPLTEVPGLAHGDHRSPIILRNRQTGQSQKVHFGEAIAQAIRRDPKKLNLYIRTPPAISIVVPCYNYAHLLPEAINSLIGGPTSLGPMPGQSFQSFEIIIVNDASPDGTREVAQAIADPFKGIRYVELPKNRGTPGAINAGLAVAYGKFANVLSADDMREPWAMEMLYRTALKHPHSIIYGDLRLFKNGQRMKRGKLPDYDFNRMLFKNCVNAGALYPMAAWREVGGYPESMVHGREDWAFAVALGITGYCGIKVQWDERGPGYLYRREGQNRTLTNTTPAWHETFLNQLRALWPHIYAGERPMGCCGGNNPRPRTRGGRARSAPQLPGRGGMVALEYTGPSHGTATWFGPETGQRYDAGKNKPIIYVDEQDAKGMLNMREKGRLLFKRYQAPKVQPAPKAPLEREPPDDGALDQGELDQLGATPVSDQDDGAADDLTEIDGVGPATAKRLAGAGLDTIAVVAGQTSESLAAQVDGISTAQARRIVKGARRLV